MLLLYLDSVLLLLEIEFDVFDIYTSLTLVNSSAPSHSNYINIGPRPSSLIIIFSERQNINLDLNLSNSLDSSDGTISILGKKDNNALGNKYYKGGCDNNK